MRRCLPWLICALLAACATPPAEPPPDGWHPVALPGKAATQYRMAVKEGRTAIEARSERSASLWRQHLTRSPSQLGVVEFSWWVQSVVPGADIAQADSEDAAARVLFAFDGDHGRLSPRNRMLFDLAQALTGERPPYATLMYVFATNATPEGTVVRGARSDRIRKIVVDAGDARARQWRMHRRDLVADFRLAFGEDPGSLLSVALMTDTDNTGTRATAWYGPVVLR